MPDFLYEPFFQDVLTSVIGSVVVLLLIYVVRIGVANVKEWRTTRGATRRSMSGVGPHSPDPPTRQEANVQVLFNVLKWSIISALLWVLGSSVPTYAFGLSLLLQICGAVFLVLALRWVLVYQKIGRVEGIDIYFQPAQSCF